MIRYARIATLGALLSLVGCASMSEDQCLASDWETVGYRDGLAGNASPALMRHIDACMPHGIAPDRDAYLEGWRAGVEQFCQPANGFNLGERGAGFSNVCPARMQHAFHAAYQDGRRLWVAQSELDKIAHAISRSEQRLQQVRAELADLSAAILEPESTPTQRAHMLLTAKDLAEEQGQLEAEIEDLQAELAVKADRLDHLRHTLALTN